VDSATTKQPHALPSPKPSLRRVITAPAAAPSLDAPPTADELDRIMRWRRASLEERGHAFAELLRLADAIGHFPPKREMFPGFRALLTTTRRDWDGA
jgi:hypothetical protein